MNGESSHGFKLIRILPFILAISLMYAPFASAQLGEIAGQLNFQVQIGHNQTIQLHLLNEGNTSIGVHVTAQALQLTSNRVLSANQPTPTIFISPENLTVPAYGTSAINITVSMPLGDTPYLASWEDIISAQEATNATNPGGALILQGVAKIISVGAIPSTTTTSTIPTTIAQSAGAGVGPLSGAALPIAVIILIIIIAIAYYYSARRPKGRKAPGRRARKEEKEEEGKAPGRDKRGEERKGRRQKATPDEEKAFFHKETQHKDQG